MERCASKFVATKWRRDKNRRKPLYAFLFFFFDESGVQCLRRNGNNQRLILFRYEELSRRNIGTTGLDKGSDRGATLSDGRFCTSQSHKSASLLRLARGWWTQRKGRAIRERWKRTKFIESNSLMVVPRVGSSNKQGKNQRSFLSCLLNNNNALDTIFIFSSHFYE